MYSEAPVMSHNYKYSTSPHWVNFKAIKCSIIVHLEENN